MKKALLLPALLFLLGGRVEAQLGIVSGSGPSICTSVAQLCINAPVSGATGYSWTVNTPTSCAGTFSGSSTGTCVFLYMPCPNQYFISVSAMTGTAVIASATYTITRAITPTITISASSTTICAGDTVILKANGANSYTWFPGNILSDSIIVAPAVTTTYSLVASNGCIGSAFKQIVVQQPGAISVSSSGSLCAGNIATLQASGANNYTWYPMNANTANVNVPGLTAGVHCFTVLGANTCGQFSATPCVTVTAAPSVSVSGLGTTLCPGQAQTLTATGANSYVWNISGTHFYTTATIVHTPTTTSNGVLFATSGVCTVTLPITFSVVGMTASQSHTMVCAGQSVTLGVTGASSHTWTNGSGVFSNSNTVIVTPSTTTSYTVQGNVSGCTIQRVITVNVVGQFLSLTGPSLVCAGSPVALQASGASGYSWTPPASSTGSTAVVYPTSTTCYSVLGWVGSCVNNAVHCVSVIPAPSVTTVLNQTMCPGDTAILASGAGTYTFSYGTTTPPYIGGSSAASQLALSPSITTGYTVSVFDGTCSSSFSPTVTLAQPASPNILGNTTICAGETTTLFASGVSSYAWSTGSTGPLLVVSPSVSTCYTLTGANSAGCSGTAVQCVTVNTTQLSYTATADTVCRGTSVTFSLAGAVSYSWSNGATVANLYVLPATSAAYTVTGMGANGCTGSLVLAVAVDTTCSDVWPGDANSDGVVGTADVLELGLAANNTGPARNGASNNYVAQECDNWSGAVSTGKNQCHADCNGDGTVNAGDTLAIHLNFGLSHTFRVSGNGTQKIRLAATSAFVQAGAWSSVDVHLGDPNDTYNNLYGITFDIGFDQQKIDAAYLEFNPSFLNANNNNIDFRKLEMASGMMYAATVRTDHNNVAGAGKIAILHFKTKAGLANNTTLNFSLSGSQLSDNAGSKQTLITSGEVVTIDNTVGVAEKAAQRPAIYPNPANAHLVIKGQQNELIVYRLFDISGRLVIDGKATQQAEINTVDISNGTYLLEITSAKNVFRSRIVIRH